MATSPAIFIRAAIIVGGVLAVATVGIFVVSRNVLASLHVPGGYTFPARYKHLGRCNDGFLTLNGSGNTYMAA